MVSSEHRALGVAAALCAVAALYVYKVQRSQQAKPAAGSSADSIKTSKRSWRQQHSKHVPGSSCCSRRNDTPCTNSTAVTATHAAVSDAQADSARERQGSSSSSEGEGWLQAFEDDAFDDDTAARVNFCSVILTSHL
jgi:hypothetical protein